MIDEVALFNFKDFQTRSGRVLAVSLLFQWLKRSTWCASVLAGSLPLLLWTKQSKQCYFLSVWRNVSVAVSPHSPHFPPFPFLFGIHFYWPPCFVPCAQRSSSKRSWDSFPPFPFVKRCVLGISMATHIRGRVNPAFPLCGFGIFLCCWSEWCGTLWLDHAAPNLIMEPNLVFMCRSSLSISTWKRCRSGFHLWLWTSAANNQTYFTGVTDECPDLSVKHWQLWESFLFVWLTELVTYWGYLVVEWSL